MLQRLLLGVPSVLAAGAVLVALSGGSHAVAQGGIELSAPPGTIAGFGGNTAPPGWLLADGSEVSRAQFPELFAAIGTTYGAGNGTTTFNLPDLRGRVAVSKGSASDVDALNESDGLGVGSRKVHHRHGKGSISASGGSHGHGMGGPARSTQGSSGAGGWGGHLMRANDAGFWEDLSVSSNTHSHPNSEFSGEVGDTSGPLNRPAYLVINHIIKS